MFARRWQAWHRHFLPQFRATRPRAGLALLPMPLYDGYMPDRTQRPVGPAPWGPQQGDGGGPKSPDVSKPDTKDLLQRMRKVDPNQSKRYRQRTGQ